MKRILPIPSSPNQEFSFAANEIEVFVVLSTAYDIMLAEVSIDGELIVAGRKCVGGVSILPRRIESMLGGRLYFDVVSGEYPSDDTLRSGDCTLVFEEF